ncbi:beta-N-acetylhexosaminidase [Paramicrobacterium humi]|uniref:Beta-N-acetylhexosaminidase n=1 Tax=Paramicrobacterium humi TaxID=640635 RepID=A0A1H4IWL9_9MICO|nr:beta-N-acetylhexosaminidase [Microbacterium humi]SEB38490.1 beta-N-acetylhexosaminidase [Microbacterium humi]
MDREHIDVAATLLPGFAGTVLPDWLAERLRHGLAGVCLFGPNIVEPAQLRRLTDAIREANPRALIAIDEEGGDVTRLHYASGSPYPGNAVLGRIDDETTTRQVATAVAAELARAGCNLDFAPSIDVNSNPANPVIGVRSFGAPPELVAQHGVWWIEGLQPGGVAACAKHFPGHGDTAEDSHLALPTVDVDEATLEARELVPFEAAIRAGVAAIMTSHIMLPQLEPDHPATMSSTILQQLLRTRLGFDGLIVSDALDMAGASAAIGMAEAAVRALSAGVDLLCLGTNTAAEQLDEIEAAVRSAIAVGRLSAERVSDAATRTLALADRYPVLPAAEDGTSPAGEVVDLDRVRESFTVDVPAEVLAAYARPGAIVRLEATVNIAVGTAPWGPFADHDAWPDVPVIGVPIDDAAPLSDDERTRLLEAVSRAAGGRAVLVIGKSNDRYPRARAVIDALRADSPDTLVVDMGWPSPDSSTADIATFGASRLVGRALIALLTAHTPKENRG